jgi:MSHA pilin protein MshA
VLEGVAGSLRSGLKIVEGKAIIAGLNTAALSCFDTATNAVIAATGTTPSCDTATGSTQVALNFGAPALDVDSVEAIAEFTGDISVVLVPATPADNTVTPAIPAVPASIVIANNATDAAATGCRVVYTPATATTTPASVVVESGTCN